MFIFLLRGQIRVGVRRERTHMAKSELNIMHIEARLLKGPPSMQMCRTHAQWSDNN
jgi:hypothetical protein